MKENKEQKVGLFGLTALVVGSSIGSGIFALPATLTAGANGGGILLGWLIVGLGMLSLVSVYRNLTLRQPKIDDGIYGWSKNSFGHLGGFIGAFGHGAGDAIGNASYLVVIFSALGAFGIFRIFGDGTTWPAVIIASVLLWIIAFLVLRGVRASTAVNNITTVTKVIPIALFIIFALLHFNPRIFGASFGSTRVYAPNAAGTGFAWTHVSIFGQSHAVLLATMWTLIGVESGTIYATRAKKLSDVAKATMIGALVIIGLLVGTTVLALGILPPAAISQLHHPSMAGLMNAMVGPWGGYLIDICLIISVLGALIAWVSLSAEEVRLAGRGKSAAKWINGLNKNEAPINAILVTAGITQALMIVAGISKAGYDVLLSFATSLALFPYLFSSIYAVKSALQGIGFQKEERDKRLGEGILALVAVCFVLFMIWGAGVKYLLLAAIVWSVGLPFFLVGKRENGYGWRPFEVVVCLVIVLMALAGIVSLATGAIVF